MWWSSRRWPALNIFWFFPKETKHETSAQINRNILLLFTILLVTVKVWHCDTFILKPRSKRKKPSAHDGRGSSSKHFHVYFLSLVCKHGSLCVHFSLGSALTPNLHAASVNATLLTFTAHYHPPGSQTGRALPGRHYACLASWLLAPLILFLYDGQNTASGGSLLRRGRGCSPARGPAKRRPRREKSGGKKKSLGWECWGGWNWLKSLFKYERAADCGISMRL